MDLCLFSVYGCGARIIYSTLWITAAELFICFCFSSLELSPELKTSVSFSNRALSVAFLLDVNIFDFMTARPMSTKVGTIYSSILLK